jgi:hypothetical protein
MVLGREFDTRVCLKPSWIRPIVAEKNENNKDSQTGQVTPKKSFFLIPFFCMLVLTSGFVAARWQGRIFTRSMTSC